MNQTTTTPPTWYTERQDATILAQLQEQATDQAPHAAAHTPGPWYVQVSEYTGQGLIMSEATGANIAVAYDGPANAALLAAAPELLAALRELCAALDAENLADGPGISWALALLRDMAQAAIAKATA